MSPISDYHRAILRARLVGLALAGRQEQELLGLLAVYCDELVARVRTGRASASQQERLRIVEQLVQELTRAMAARTGTGIRLTTEEVAGIHARATIALAGELAVGAAFEGLGVRAAQAVLARPELSRAFVSIRREAIQGVDGVLKRGLLRGASADQLERELRMYVGAPRVARRGGCGAVARPPPDRVQGHRRARL